MSIETYGPGGYDPAKPNANVLEEWDDATRTYTNAITGDSRPYTPAENAAADALAAQLADQAARRATLDAVRVAITDLQAERTRLDAVLAKSNAQLGPADTKDVARAGKRIAGAAIDLARIVKDLT